MSEEVKPPVAPEVPAPVVPPPSATSEKPPEGVEPVKPTDVKPVEPPKEGEPQKDSTEKPPEKSVVPEKYELKLPEGSLLDAKAQERIASIAREQGLSNDDAQKLLESQSADISAHVEAQKSEWAKEAMNDKEIGGAHFKENVANAWRLVDRFCPPEFKQELDRFGYGNHPGLIKMFSRVWREGFGEDKFVRPGAVTPPAPKAPHEILYGSESA